MTEAIFLSASVPDPRRKPIYYRTADVVAIREAVRALATVTLGRALLVFGGHPAITPLVRQVGEALGKLDKVRIYQSRLFVTAAPADNDAFRWLQWVDAVEGDERASLRVMREAMLRRRSFRAAVFIGGMEGIDEEFAMFQQMHPRTLCLPVASTGAAALTLHERLRPSLDGETLAALAHETAYGAMFERLIWPSETPD